MRNLQNAIYGMYQCHGRNIINFADGAYTLTVISYDTVGNSAFQSLSLRVALEPPPAPTITAPQDGKDRGQVFILDKLPQELYKENRIKAHQVVN